MRIWLYCHLMNSNTNGNKTFLFIDIGYNIKYNKDTENSTLLSIRKKRSEKMIATKPIDLRANLKTYLDNAFNGEPVIVSRKNNQNVVILSEREYNDMMKAKRNAEYLAKLQRGISALNAGNGTEHEIIKDYYE